ncbi:hypothetical protein PN4B1_17180 [Paenibacillus naphthalenovorans]|uniref:hypothetical protein n=1 Tax=Paenibacillus naphthalenovorans TaxID=162209 RepID=UPI0010BB2A2C|nr:hypothetical protein [Paenibacillus naphthalenovorans]GCL71813.1 hypothetical protein PN4B1_17180 [Paenibacillus naphthalenovorans]
MIMPLACAVDDYVFNAVAAICGEETAFKLCYEDYETYFEVKSVVDAILNGIGPGGKPIEEGEPLE